MEPEDVYKRQVQDIFLAVQLKVKSHDFAEADILFLIYGNFSLSLIHI